MTKTTRSTRWTVLTTVLLLALTSASVASAKEKKKENTEFLETYRVTAMSVGTGITGATNLNIRISRWSTDEERKSLLESISTQRTSTGLVSELFHMEPTGNIQVVGKLAYEFRYAREFMEDGRRIVILATDRPIGIGEALGVTRSREFDVGLVRLDLDPETGEGTGHLSIGTRIWLNEETDRLVIETGGTQPIDLTKVRMVKTK